ncbi:uncharacterized protein [Diadema setosum]|uniref:uncharacterized protein n=1 Tax=Diadema setosum TaxID=31175 RepID=UPI003B3A51DB
MSDNSSSSSSSSDSEHDMVDSEFPDQIPAILPTDQRAEIKPYRFEPELEDEGAVGGEENEEDIERRLGNDYFESRKLYFSYVFFSRKQSIVLISSIPHFCLLFRCSCSGGCVAMPTVRESVCCKEIPRVVEKMDSFADGGDLDCITMHPGFKTVCLDKYVLETAYYQYEQQYDEDARGDATDNERNRHVAYRQLVRWCWRFLGRYVRVPLPSCAVNQIRKAFPSQEYKGFEL